MPTPPRGFSQPFSHANYARDNYTCAYCGYHDHTKSGDNLTLDHFDEKAVESRAKGEAAHKDPTRLITACRPCNSAMQTLAPRQFKVYLKERGTIAAGNVEKIKGDLAKLDPAKDTDKHALLSQRLAQQQKLAAVKPQDFTITGLRKQASKPIDMKQGAKLAEQARAYRDAKGIVNPAVAAKLRKEAEARAQQEKSAPEQAKPADPGKAPEPGSGLHPDDRKRDDHGRFEAEA